MHQTSGGDQFVSGPPRGIVVSGELRVVHEGGDEVELKPGDAYVIDPGHDAWVTGSAPYVGYQFEATTVETYAQPSG